MPLNYGIQQIYNKQNIFGEFRYIQIEFGRDVVFE